MKRLANVVEIIFLVIMLLMCAVIIMAGRGNVPFIFGYRVLQVVTDSMMPTISGETCIIIAQVEQEDIQVGDIITFVSESPQIKGFLNTHRVYEITEDAESGETLYITIGDASNKPDPYPVAYDQIVGRYVRELPYGEWLYRAIRFLADQVNYFIIVILPLLLCCLSYVRQFFKALFGKEEEPVAEDIQIVGLEEEDANEEGRCC